MVLVASFVLLDSLNTQMNRRYSEEQEETHLGVVMNTQFLDSLADGLSQSLPDDFGLVLVTLVSQQLTKFVIVEVTCESRFDTPSVNACSRGLGWKLRRQSVIDDIGLNLIIVIKLDVR